MEQPQEIQKLDWKKIAEDLKLRIHNAEVSLELAKAQLAKAVEFAAKK